METLFQDLRYGFRMFLKTPGFAAVIVLTLALGIGANTAIFSVVNAVLLRPLPFKDPDRLMVVLQNDPAKSYYDIGCTPPDFRELKERNRVFDQMAAFYTNDFNLSEGNEPEQFTGAVVSSNLFPLLRVEPALGRSFLRAEEQFGNHRVVLLAYGLWQRRFGSDRSLTGRLITLNGEKFTVLGVMSPEFQFPNKTVQLWTPMAFELENPMNTRGNHFLNVVARLKPAVTEMQAQQDLDRISRQLEQEYKEDAGLNLKVVTLHARSVGDVKSALLVLLGAVAFVLLISCANVANLLLARSTVRQREMAIRSALGASRGRVIRQMLTESVLLAMLGGSLGLLLALWGIPLLVRLAPADFPRLSEAAVESRALLFTLVISLLTGMVFGLAPAWQTSNPHLDQSLREGGRGTTGGLRNRLRSLLVVAEVALSLTLLIGAGLMVKSFQKLRTVNPGFKPDSLLTLQVSLPIARYPLSRPERTMAFFQELVDRIQGLPGVKAVAGTSSLPFSGQGIGRWITLEDRPAPNSIGDTPVVQYHQLTSGYLQAMGIPLKRGRFFTERDSSGSPEVALINETMARRFWLNDDPIGKRIRFPQRIRIAPPDNLITLELLRTILPGYVIPRPTIVGVVKDVKHFSLSQPDQPEIYVPHLQAGIGVQRSMAIVVRTVSHPMSLIAAIREQVKALDKDQPVARITTMEQLLSDSILQPRFNMLLLTIFAVLAWLLAAMGIYGVISYVVTQRSHEIGIRMALGAQKSDVVRLVVGRGMFLVMIGVAISLAASVALTRVLSSLLYDPMIFAGVSMLLAGVALLASYIPARRATQVDPIVVLRYE